MEVYVLDNEGGLMDYTNVSSISVSNQPHDKGSLIFLNPACNKMTRIPPEKWNGVVLLKEETNVDTSQA